MSGRRFCMMPKCRAEPSPGQLLCSACFTGLPRKVRGALTVARREGQWDRWRTLVLTAAGILAPDPEIAPLWEGNGWHE